MPARGLYSAPALSTGLRCDQGFVFADRAIILFLRVVTDRRVGCAVRDLLRDRCSSRARVWRRPRRVVPRPVGEQPDASTHPAFDHPDVHKWQDGRLRFGVSARFVGVGHEFVDVCISDVFGIESQYRAVPAARRHQLFLLRGGDRRLQLAAPLVELGGFVAIFLIDPREVLLVEFLGC